MKHILTFSDKLLASLKDLLIRDLDTQSRAGICPEDMEDNLVTLDQ